MAVQFDTLKHYQRYFKRLIELERQEEINFHLNEIESISGFSRERKGRALMALSAREFGRGLGGIFIVRLSRDDELPDLEIGVGDLVILSKGKPSGNEAQAVVTEKSKYMIAVAYNNPPPDFLRKQKIRLDLFANDITFKRMDNALFKLNENQALAQLLLSKREPQLIAESNSSEPIQTELNDIQKKAVRSICNASECYLVHGPPGTGKTTTLVEAIMQLARKGNRILATADSNTAVDNIVEKLVSHKCRVIRIGNPARMNKEISSVTLEAQVQNDGDFQQAAAMRDIISELKSEQNHTIKPTGRSSRGMNYDEILLYSSRGSGGRGLPVHKIHKMAEWIRLQQQIDALFSEARRLENKSIHRKISEADVVCTTNSGSGSDILTNYTFDIATIDEATQSMEPSCLIPMTKASKWILAGDHRQLPPTVLSREAKDLNHTLFERWINILSDRNHTLLNLQYRMNQSIMVFSSKEFYDSRLKASPMVKNHHIGQLTGFEIPKDIEPPYDAIIAPENPLCFINVANGKENQLDGSYSYYNKKEAEILISTIHSLMNCRLFPADIGIISPYEQQVNNIRSQLHDSGIEVKTVDGFQGREKEIVLISLVRANKNGNLGFLTDYRRLNVAITRGRRKVIILGHIPTLKTDPIYNKLIYSIKSHITISE